MFDWLKKRKAPKKGGQGPKDSRRAFLRGDFIPDSKEVPSTAQIVLLRPPGAIAEETFLERCTRCGDCGAACPHQAIVFAPDRFREAARTPMINAHNAPCRMCVDMPCIKACPEDALLEAVGFQMGKAKLQTFNCLAYNRNFCSVCEERCPAPGAITFEAAKPVFNADVCTGCGVCHHVCPAPVNAVMILPNRDRPIPPEVAEDESSSTDS